MSSKALTIRYPRGMFVMLVNLSLKASFQLPAGTGFHAVWKYSSLKR